jgi:TPR repeat protein
MLVAIGEAASAGPLEDVVAAYHRGDHATALRLGHQLAERGDADAQFRLGVMYESGQGCAAKRRRGDQVVSRSRRAG